MYTIDGKILIRAMFAKKECHCINDGLLWEVTCSARKCIQPNLAVAGSIEKIHRNFFCS